MAKIVAAFIGGMVVALGGALMYVRSGDLSAPRAASTQTAPPAISTPAPVPKTDPVPAPATISDSAVEPPRAAHKPEHSAFVIRRAKAHAVIHRADSVAATRAEIAQNTPPPDPTPVSPELPAAPAPQVNPPQTPDQPSAPVNDPAQAPAPPPPPQPHVVTLPAGTMIDIRLGETVSTDHNYTGDTFRATLQSPIIMDGFIIADHGSKVLGRVVNAQKAGRMEGFSALRLALTEINTTDGQRVQINTDSYDNRGASNSRSEAEKIGGAAALGAIIGALGGGGKGAAIGAGVGGAAGTGAVLLSHPKPATIPSETRLQFRLTTPVTITEKLNN